MGFHYIRESGIKKLAKDFDKRCGKDFLHALDVFVYDVVARSCTIHNGCKKTLDRTVAKHILGK